MSSLLLGMGDLFEQFTCPSREPLSKVVLAYVLLRELQSIADRRDTHGHPKATASRPAEHPQGPASLAIHVTTSAFSSTTRGPQTQETGHRRTRRLLSRRGA